MLLTQIAELDNKADLDGLEEDEWVFRYHLEDQLLHLYRMEEEN